ncbi:GntR family transcriptional regulator [Pullulanibacillus camelliae]|uniref:GntR family transcriptional regulator n=1 Tax=Pullulanibacillus camelliae TaxID=1707096 RepID=A0A8J2YMS2_9BACL|nr:GntR family transcriptional regulator [Pullulanibacillus camelliae]GGE55583.1 GntR family transcriptional regulator [Pullulanibacillus camelliae]
MSQPLYLQVANQIKNNILHNVWTDKLPSEKELCKQFGVSRITLRRAVQDLCDEGLIDKRHGLGMFVGKNDYQLVGSVLKDRLFNETLIEHKLFHISREVQPDGFVRNMLKLESSDKTIYLERLVSHQQEQPIDYEKVWIPTKYDNGTLIEKISTFDLVIPALEQSGIMISKTRLMLEPQILDKDFPSLKLSKGAPVLLLWRIAFDEKEQPVALIEHHMTQNGAKSLLHFDFPNKN